MSKAIQESLELPVLEDLLKSSFQEGATDEDEVTDDMVEQQESIDLVEQMDANLSSGNVPTNLADIQAIKDHEGAMDTIYTETLQHAKDLMDLGYNVDTRSAGRIFENAANMFKIALDSKNSKRDAQLKRLKLQLDERKQELAEKGARGGEGEVIDGEVTIIEDRNALIKMLKGNNK